VLPHQKLEKDFAAFTGSREAVVVNSGTAALHLAVHGKNYPKGSEIIVPEFTMIATAWGPYYCGHKCVFIDCDNTLNIDPSLIESNITANTKAILITHVYGRVCSVEKVYELCLKYGLDLIEDCAEAHGAVYSDGPLKGSHVGSLDIGCFSFYGNKIVHGEEGGAVTTRNSKYANSLRDMRSMCFGSVHNYKHQSIGFNYRMPSSQASLTLESLSEIDSSLQRRKEIESLYDFLLDEDYKKPNRDVVWVYDINHPDPFELVVYLNQKGIAARRAFYPMSLQPCFNLGSREEFSNLKSLEKYHNTCYLPVSTTMLDEEVVRVCEEVRNFRS